MNREQLEYSISRYLDGTLPATERLSLDIRLNQDSEARTLLAEYRAFDESLNMSRSALPAIPAIDWDALSSQISASIDRAQEMGEIGPPAVAGRIGFGGNRRWMAIAASLIISAGVVFSVLRTRPHIGAPSTNKEVAQAIEINMVDAPSSDDGPAQTAPVIVAVGPSSESGNEPAIWRYSDDVVSRSTAVVIASGNRPAQDTLGFPY